MAEPSKETSAKAPSTQPIDWRKVHLWQIQPVRDGLVVAAIIGVVYLGKLVSIVTVPMLLALLLAYLFEPLIRRVTATRHISRQGAALSIILLAGVLIIVPLVIGTVVGVVQGANVIASVAQNSTDLLKSVDPKATQEEARAAYYRLDPGFWRWSSDEVRSLSQEVEAYRANRDRLLNQKAVVEDPLAGPLETKTDPVPLDDDKDGGASPAEATSSDKPGGEAAKDNAADPVPPLVVPDKPLESEISSGEEDAEPPPDTPVPDSAVPPPAAEEMPHLPAWKEQLYDTIESSREWLKEHSQEVAQTIGRRALGTGAQILQTLVGIFGSVGYVLFSAFITAFFFFFFSTGWGRVLDFWEGLIPDRRKHRTIELVQKMDSVIAGFVRGRLTICFILSVYMTGAYLIIGVPSAFLLGPIVGLLFIVPYVHVVGVPFAMLLMFLEPSSVEWQNSWWWIVTAPIAVYMGAQVLDDYVLSPMIQGKNTNMDTPTIVFASLAGGALAGIYGLLIAIPVAACIKILFQEIFFPRVREWAHGKKPDILPIE